MSKGLKATVNPSVLVWARKTASYTVQSAAEKLGYDEGRIVGWEQGTEQPSIPQLRKLADLYKRPLAVMYLPEPPMTFQAMHDFRRLPESGHRDFSPGLALEIRTAQQRRQLALELYAEDGEGFATFNLSASLKSSTEAIGESIRKALAVSLSDQAKWKDPRVAFHAWRSKIEELGVLVFQASRIDSEEASGFAFYAEQLPFIVVNRKDVWGRRVFSLFHELAHLALHRSGVSDLDSSGIRHASDQRIEAYCNQVAASVLMPKSSFLSEPIIANGDADRRDWSDADIENLAKTYSVSREAVVRRLLTFGRTTEAFYIQKRAEYAREYAALRRRQRELPEKKPIPRNMPRETVNDAGRPLVMKLLSHYHSERLSLSELSGYLGVKTKHIAGIEQALGLA
ncbi:ImmA/IrrE family metallo-endopeptidase [Sandaracinobacteroides sp. A072]|uniref:ImmA/IrrE family metallo-endopeptidase n=1 Tax=Sandaracinobacteroides sp. A072 TaxID=3461146 RepID=UPI00404209E0